MGAWLHAIGVLAVTVGAPWLVWRGLRAIGEWAAADGDEQIDRLIKANRPKRKRKWRTFDQRLAARSRERREREAEAVAAARRATSEPERVIVPASTFDQKRIGKR
jgi:hypothetical protein